MPKLPVEINLDLTDSDNTYLRTIFNKLKSKKYLPLSKAVISGIIDIKNPPIFNYNLKVSYIDLYYKTNNNNKESHSL